jgi:hypothetical protein
MPAQVHVYILNDATGKRQKGHSSNMLKKLENASVNKCVSLKGDKKYRIPPLDPLNVQEVVLTDGGARAAGLRLVLKNVKAYGLKDCEIDKIE